MGSPPAIVHEPATREALDALLTRAASRGESVAVVGGLRSFSRLHRGAALLTRAPRGGVRFAAAEEHPALASEAPVWVGAGCTFGELALSLAARGRALHNVPGWEGLDVLGALSSGSHGSGLHLGPLSNAVRAVRLATVDARGRVVHRQLLPAGSSARASSAGPREAHRDDALFHAATVSLGALGVLTEVLLATRGAYNLEEVRTLHRWSELRARLPELAASTATHSVQVWLNPYARGEEDAVLTAFREVAREPRGSRPFAMRYGGRPLLRALPYALLRWVPRSIPWLHRAALRATVHRPRVAPSWEALTLGSANDVPVTGAGFAVPFSSTASATDALLELLRSRARERGAYLTTPLALRFVGPGHAWLSPQHGRPTTMLEVALVEGTAELEGTLAAASAMLRERFDARPHWGQRLCAEPAALLRAHPGCGAFREARAALDPRGLFGGAALRAAFEGAP